MKEFLSFCLVVSASIGLLAVVEAATGVLEKDAETNRELDGIEKKLKKQQEELKAS